MSLATTIRDISITDALHSYNNLVNSVCSDYPTLGRAGLPTLDLFFFDHRLKVKTKNISFYQAINDTNTRNHLDTLIYKYKKLDIHKLDKTHLYKNRYAVFQLYYGSVNQFRPIVAKWLYCLLQPKTGIMDFSAGWGARCLAALSMDIPYIGIDSNTNLRESYNKMISVINKNARVKMIFKPAETVDFSQFKYDLCFTSPPYFTIEKYEKMPLYLTKNDFYNTFLIPTIVSAWKYLQNGGFMALNMPVEMYTYIIPYLPPILTILQMPLANRHSKQARNTTKLTASRQITENIYVWHKCNFLATF